MNLSSATYLNIVADGFSLVEVSCFSRIIHLTHCSRCSGMVWGTWCRVQGVDQASICGIKFDPWYSTSQPTGLEGFTTNVLLTDTTQDTFSFISMQRTNSILDRWS